MNINSSDRDSRLRSLTFTDRSVLYRQISDTVRAEIKHGHLQPGMKLPPTAELAEAWGMQVATVHKAMSILVREGLLMRRPKLGTFVAEKPSQIEALGILTVEHANSERFKLSVLHWLEKLAQAKGVRCVPFAGLETREHSNKRLPSPHALGFQALVGVGVNATRVQKLSKLHVPSAFFSSSRLLQTVDMQVEEFLLEAVQQLAGTGVKRLVILTHVHPNREGRHSSFERALADALPLACEKAGIEILRTPYGETDLPGRDYTPTELEELGFRQFATLWAASRRPDAVIAYPSTVARGVVTSVLSQRVNVPQDLRLVLGRTKEAPFLCPFPATLYEVSTEVIAKALLDLIFQQFDGSPQNPVLLPFEKIIVEP